MTHLLRSLAHFCRLNMAPLTMSVPVLGALAADSPLFTERIVGLALVGLCAHIFGFGLNDLVDYPLDRTLAEHRQHPLVTGEISRRWAWLFTLAQIPVSLLIYRALNGGNSGLALLALSAIFSVVYNRWSKWGHFPRLLAELALAASTGLLCLAGGLIAGPFTGGMVFAGTVALVLLLVNSVPSGLKDLKTDAAFGAGSFVLSTGCHMLDDDRLVITARLRLYTVIVQGMIAAGLVGSLALFSTRLFAAGLVILLNVYAMLHIRMLLRVRSFRALLRSMPLLGGYYHYAALLLLVIDRMPAWMQILAALLVLSVLAVPLRLFIQTWRRRYDAL